MQSAHVANNHKKVCVETSNHSGKRLSPCSDSWNSLYSTGLCLAAALGLSEAFQEGCAEGIYERRRDKLSV